MKIKFSESNLYINKLFCVIRSQRSFASKPFLAKCRHSDAFVYVISGSCIYEFNDGISFTAREGDVIYLPKNAHYLMNDKSDVFSYIFCDFEFDCPEARESELFSPKSPSDTYNLFLRLYRIYEKGQTSFEECLSLLYKIIRVLKDSRASEYLPSSAKHKISAACQFLDENFRNPSISISQAAEKSAMSEVYFRKLFKSVYGITPSEYLTQMRIENAKMLMKYPFLSLKDCAEQSGFSSLAYFCHAFKEKTGEVASKYRRDCYR